MRVHAKYTGSTLNPASAAIQSRKIYEHTRKLAAEIIHNARKRASTRLQRCRIRARAEGFNEGFHDGLRRAQTQHLESHEHLRETIINARRECLKIAGELAREIIRREVEVDHGILAARLDDLINRLLQAGDLTVIVSPADSSFIRHEISTRFAERRITVEEDADIAPGNARVVSASGSIEMLWEYHLELLERHIQRTNADVC